MGGTPEENAATIRGVFDGSIRDARRNAVLINAAGALTFGLAPWLQTSKPVAAGLFILGIPFMLLSHLWLFCRRR